MTMTLLPADARAASPWKNGKGITRELAAFPPGSDMDRFEWRVSIAEVRAGGPFSDFPGIDRTLAVLEGTLLLSIGTAAPMTLSPGSGPVAFPGDIPCQAAIAGHAVQDLNVMTRRGRFSSRMTGMKADRPIATARGAFTTLLVSLCDLVVETEQSAIVLKRLDAVSFDEPLVDGMPIRCQRLGGNVEAIELYLIELFPGGIS